jgi:hypothetical protein
MAQLELGVSVEGYQDFFVVTRGGGQLLDSTSGCMLPST